MDPLSSIATYQKIALPHGSADAKKLAQLALQSDKPLVIFTPDVQTAGRLRDEITFFGSVLDIVLLMDWETLVYDRFSAHQDLVSERLSALWRMQQQLPDVILIPINTALMFLPPVDYLLATTFLVKKHQILDLHLLRQNLIRASYHCVNQVFNPGEFAIRGGIIDIFPMGSPTPYRIELFDNKIESIRIFETDTQRSVQLMDEIRVLPAREFPLDEKSCQYFRQRFREIFDGGSIHSPIYKDISKGIASAGIEYYLPLFFKETATIFDYVPKESLLVLYPGIEQTAQLFFEDVTARYQLLRGDIERPLLPPAMLLVPVPELLNRIKAYPVTWFDASASSQTQALPPLQIDRHAENPIGNLQDFIQTFSGNILIFAESLGRRESILNLLHGQSLKLTIVDNWAHYQCSPPKLGIIVGPLANGFVEINEDNINPLEKTQFGQTAFITEYNLYNQKPQLRSTRRNKRFQNNNFLRDLAEIKPGDAVVHEQHGIGRYKGLVSMDLGEGITELMLLEYAGSDNLYIPVNQLNLITRYSGAASDQVILHRLGAAQWEKAKRRAIEKVRDTAAELLNLYARRAAKQGYAFQYNMADYQRFVEGFGFEETPEQALAIEAVIQDMAQNQPMDRLICGDVGFGKTEVALRAAYIAVSAGKQVVILVPTTLLAEQHYQTFTDRFSDTPVHIAELSRFRTTKESRQVLEGMAKGTIDIVIGTHKLLQENVIFHNLGLIIIDEEHRFGVRHKEKLKTLRANIDVLALTATPIPRTLAMSLEGLRDFSVITTPPQRRLAIKTLVTPFSNGTIREATLRELKRGGQVFFLYNAVESISPMQERLAQLLPEARIGVAHGQMRERDLEHVMRDFYQQRFNFLLCTTIIETGIDVPNANTIIIHRADKFGLAQLHQLRGRVGRSHHQAYAYLLTPDEEALTLAARQRLEAIQSMEELGSGFYLAMHDLEIRGAGEVLGESQSGEIHDIGFTLYSAMLNEAVRALKNGTEPDLEHPLGITTEVNLHSPALLPAVFCPDIHERLLIYKRLAHCENITALNQLKEELIDRFGLLTQPVNTLLDLHHLRIIAKPIGVLKIDVSEQGITIQFAQKNAIDSLKIAKLIQHNPNYKLLGPEKLRIEIPLPEVSTRCLYTRTILHDLIVH